LPLVRGFSLDDPLGWRDGHPIALQRVLQAAHAIAAQLPRGGHCINLCEDRLNFIVGFAAALIARSTTVLPHNRAPDVLEELRRLYRGVQTVADHDDAEHPGGLRLDARDWPGAGVPADVPSISTAHCAAVLFTSGSTGAPQPHAKTWGSLVRAARAAQARLQIGAGSVLLGAVPPQHMWGFEMTVMLPLQAACSVDASCPLLPADIAAALARLPTARWLVATPLHLQACLASAQPMPPLAGVLCATAALSTELAQAVERSGRAAMGNYGSTETERSRRDGSPGNANSAPWTASPGGKRGKTLRGADSRRAGGAWRPRGTQGCGLLRAARPHADLSSRWRASGPLAALNSELARVPGVRDGVFWLRDGPRRSAPRRVRRRAGMSAAQCSPSCASAWTPCFCPDLDPRALAAAQPRRQLTRRA
jgi:hypothetical protein